MSTNAPAIKTENAVQKELTKAAILKIPWTNAAPHSRKKKTHQSINTKYYSVKAVFESSRRGLSAPSCSQEGKNINNPFVPFAKKHLSKIEIPNISLREFLKIGSLRVLFLRINGDHKK